MVSITFDNVTKRFRDGTTAVSGLNLEVPDGEFMILVGPSGCGKTTALRMVAGLEEVTQGRIFLGDREINDVDPGRRDISMIFQNYALFPHMTVFENMAFPLRMRGVKRNEVTAAVNASARMLGLADLLRRKPNQLSGGQRQRVAMGRAIVRHPQAFLMDEPLSNLDAKLRTQMRGELARLHLRLGVTTLYVTHDQTEAMTLGSHVAVMRDGLVQQVGSPQELYRSPRNAFVARFIGSPPMNILRGSLVDGQLLADGQPHHVDVRHRWAAPDGQVLIGVRPEICTMGSIDVSGDTLSIVGEVEMVEDLGAETIVYAQTSCMASDSEAAVEDAFAAKLHVTQSMRPGDRVVFSAPVESLHLFDVKSGEAIPLQTDGPKATAAPNAGGITI